MWRKLVIIFILFCTLAFPACRGTGEGPLSWIDQPLDKEIFPHESLTLQAHASDSDGISAIEFLVNGDSILSVSVNGERLENAAVEWLPPEPGEYLVAVKATDNSGNAGPLATSRITIAGADFVLPLPLPSEKIAEAEEDEEEEEMIQVAEEQLPEAVASQGINCRGGPGMEYDVLAVFPPNLPALIVGRLSSSTWLVISHPEKSLDCWVAANIVSVEGDLNTVQIAQAPPPPEKPPEEEPPPAPPEPEKDTTPPVIASVSLSPSTIYENGCSSYTQTSTLTVEVTDPGGVAHVEAAWSTGSVVLTHKGGSTYQGVVGPIDTMGSVTVFGSAIDEAGNWTPFSVVLEVDCCIC